MHACMRLYVRRWIANGALMFIENVHNISFAPANSFVNSRGCRLGDYEWPIVLGMNVVNVTAAE